MKGSPRENYGMLFLPFLSGNVTAGPVGKIATTRDETIGRLRVSSRNEVSNSEIIESYKMKREKGPRPHKGGHRGRACPVRNGEDTEN